MKLIFYLFFVTFIFTSCGEDLKKSEEGKTKSIEKSGKERSKDSSNVSEIKSADTILVLTNNGNGQYGYKDTLGNWVIKPEFELAGEFSDRLAPVLSMGKWHLMNKSGKMVYDFEKVKPIVIHNELSGEDHVLPITEKTIAIEFADGKQGFLKLFNGKFTAKFDEVQSFSDGRAAIRIGEKWGFITLDGRYLVKPSLDGAYSFSDKRAIVISKNSYGIIDVDGRIIAEPKYRSAFRYKEGVTFVSNSSEYRDYFLVDLNGNVINNGPYESVFNLGFENGECEVHLNGKCIIIDKSGKKIRDSKNGCQEGC